MIFDQPTRSCTLVLTILIALPLCLLLFYYDQTTAFYQRQKLVFGRIINKNVAQIPCLITKPTFELLEDVETAGVVPNRNLSSKQIFFMETSHPEGGFLKINAREACAIESAAKTHPNYNIYVLFAGWITRNPNENSTKLVNNILETYSNVHFRRLDMLKFSENTPTEEFFKKRMYRNSDHLQTHLADVLRLLALYKYGGMYFDLDVVVLNDTTELGENVLAEETEFGLMSGTMRFSGNGVGHAFTEECLKDVAANFQSNTWGGNGPDLITRTMHKFCGTNNLTEMTVEACQGIKVIKRELFLPLWYPIHDHFFNPDFAHDFPKVVEGAYTAHIFNYMNHDIKLYKGQKAGYLTLAEIYCPVVFGTLEDGDLF